MRPITIALLLALLALGVSCGDESTEPATEPAPTVRTVPPRTSFTLPSTTTASTTTTTEAPAELDPSTPLVTVTLEGGLCPDQDVCRTRYELHPDGTATVDGEPVAASFAEEADELVDSLRAVDVAALELPRFTGVCPQAYDGQERIIAFPQHGATFAGCDVEIDDTRPPFAAVTAAVTAIAAAR